MSDLLVASPSEVAGCDTKIAPDPAVLLRMLASLQEPESVSRLPVIRHPVTEWERVRAAAANWYGEGTPASVALSEGVSVVSSEGTKTMPLASSVEEEALAASVRCLNSMGTREDAPGEPEDRGTEIDDDVGNRRLDGLKR